MSKIFGTDPASGSGETIKLDYQSAPVKRASKKALWAGWIISALPALFLLMDSVMKLYKPTFVVEGTVKLGFSQGVIVPLGIVLLVCTILYIIPQTAVLGAILLTGYLGGAVATHVHANGSLFGEILFPVYVGILVWLGLYLRDRRVRNMVPIRSL